MRRVRYFPVVLSLLAIFVFGSWADVALLNLRDSDDFRLRAGVGVPRGRAESAILISGV